MSDRAAIPFDDGKARDAMRTIGEVAAGFGIKQHILRYWEQQFPMLRPLKRSGGRRLYRPEDVALVSRINQLINQQGYTLKGARQVIESGTNGAGQAASPSTSAQAAPTQTLSAQPAVQQSVDNANVLARLKDIRARLSGALAAA
ncbi:hypothetical protein GCM10009127_23890 [Alteraurantiacibacter aestuarii]|uniref:MerR family transcriptional regulator n=1 Tax=Alteraurantiacibacter aestuarii TaxID=650004 RepID=UPI0031D1C34A